MSASLPLDFDGPAYSREHDHDRLHTQLEDVRQLMLDGAWRTLAEIARHTGHPPASISAQLRHLRKPRFGGHLVERRSRGAREKGLHEYRLTVVIGGTRKAKRNSERLDELLKEVARLRARIQAGEQ